MCGAVDRRPCNAWVGELIYRVYSPTRSKETTMVTLRSVFKAQRPPYKIKIFAPNGETRELVGWLGIRTSPSVPIKMELFLLHEEGSTGRIEVINKKVVVVNKELGETIYDPRQVLRRIFNQDFLSKKEVNWLRDNPQWPDILELKANPVDNREGNDGA